jgi:hypothetical protein
MLEESGVRGTAPKIHIANFEIAPICRIEMKSRQVRSATEETYNGIHCRYPLYQVRGTRGGYLREYILGAIVQNLEDWFVSQTSIIDRERRKLQRSLPLT